MRHETNVEEKPRAFAISSADVTREGDDHLVYGNVTWHTLISADRTPSREMVFGIAHFEPGGWLGLHSHAPAEFYFGLSGEGTATIDGAEFRIAPGVAVYIPGNAEHGVVAGLQGLSFAYGFAVHAFNEIAYRYSAEAAKS
ncbi:MAG: cupin domain-containing protein [Hyphomicrobium sp.]